MKNKETIFAVYYTTFVGIIFFIGMTFLAPYLKSQSTPWNILFYGVFSPICHQIPSRCFSIFGYPLAVCARCLGIYFGFFAGTGLYPFLRGFSSPSLPKTKTFILMSLPLAIDTFANVISFWRSPGLLRFVFGSIWGFLLPFYFIPGLSEALISWMAKKLPNSKT